MTRNQRYSDLVFARVQGVGEHGDMPKRYKSLCKRAGGILRTVGLIQFLAFITAKAERGELHYQMLTEHLREELNALHLTGGNDARTLLAVVQTMDLPAYMQTTRAALQLLQWHKRIAEIMIHGDADDSDEEE